MRRCKNRFVGCRRAAVERLEGRRLLNAGDLDTLFGTGGKHSVDLDGKPFETMDVAIQLDGKVLLAGRRVIFPSGPQGGGSYRNGVVRLNVNGSLDTTFGGGDGFAEFDLMDIRGIDVDGTSNAIILCGSIYNPSRSNSEFAVARLQPNGSPDPSFGGGDGFTNIMFDGFLETRSFANAVMIDRQHRIVAAGARYSAGITSIGDYDFALARFHPDGSLDSSFDGDGKVVYNFGDQDIANALTIDYSGNPGTDPRYGQIVLAGTLDIEFDDNAARFAVARFSGTGQPDNSFHGDGAVTTVFAAGANSVASGVVVQPGNRIVVTGTHDGGNSAADKNLITIRYHATGSIDGSFGTLGTGFVETDLGGFDKANSLTVGYLGGLLVGGTTWSGAGGHDMAIVAYTADGILDTRFSQDGILTIDVNSNVDKSGVLAVTGSQIAPVRKIVIAGSDGSVARVVDVGSLISVGTFQPNMYEQGSVPTSFLVTRTQALPFAETIVLTTSGTATTLGAARDFNATGILFGNGQTTSTQVVIPAGATSVTVTLTPIDDARVEGDETITFTVNTSLTYDASATRSTTLVVRDNDLVGGPAVIASGFHFETYPQNAPITFNQNVQATFTIGDLIITRAGGSPPLYSLDYNNVTNTGTVVFYNGLTDGDYTVTVKGSGVTVGGTPMAGDYTFGFFFMNADANRDRAVNFDDLLILAQNYGQSGKTFSQGDFDYSPDGLVGFDDLLLLAQRYGTSLPSLVTIEPIAVKPATAAKKRESAAADVIR